MDLTKEDYEILTSYLPIIETIVRNASCSNIPLDFRTAIVNMGKKYKTISCDSCNRELYLCICRLYDKYLEYKNKLKKNGKKGRAEKKGNID